MFTSDRILTLNVGASKIVLAEFQAKSGQAPELINYGIADLPVVEENSGVGLVLTDAIKSVMKTSGIRPAPLAVALSGQIVFPRFVKLPAVAKDKLLQMIQYEVEQNVPFPLNEIVWNYQFIGDDSTGEQSVMIVAAKIESVREITDAIVKAGLEPEIVDVAPMAICNALRFNHDDLDGCSIVLDIGARSTNLIFVEDDRIYSRCIPVAGNAITQELAKSLQVSLGEAEQIKRQKGFVSLGGVHVSEDEQIETISRVIRNVITRLHAEISRSINFYRSQQGGAAPVRLILTGGSAVLPHLDQFFREKLQIEVAYLNPFVNVGVGKRIDVEKAGHDAFMLAESVGLALRRSLHCPIEVNLMPPELVKSKTMKRRVPFLSIAAVGVLMSLGIWYMYERRMEDLYTTQTALVETKLGKIKQMQSKMDKATSARTEIQRKADAVRDAMSARTAWLKRIEAVKSCLFDGLWLLEMAPMKSEAGELTGIRITGRGWADKLKAQEEKAKANGSAQTAIELLRDQLKTKAFFGDDVPVSVQIVGVKEVEAYLMDFTIEITPATAAPQEGKRRAQR